MAKVCALCRERGMTCDGTRPVCGPCVEFGATTNCDFSSRAGGPNTKSTHLLQKGAACLPCRRKKKKCDAKRPCCSTCKASNKQAQCLYEDDAQKNLIQSLVARTRQLEEKLASSDHTPREYAASPDSSSSSSSSDSHSLVVATSEGRNTYPTWKPPAADSTVSRPLAPRTTLEHFSLFRSTFLEFSSTVGVKLGEEARAALLRGDFNSPHIHPALIHASQLLGCMIWQEHHFTTSSLVTVEMFELSSALSMIQEDTKPLVAIQVFNILSVYYFVRGQLIEAMEKVRATSELVRRHNIRFLSSPDDLWDPLAAPSPEAEEQVCALSYHMYKSIVGHLSLGVPSELGLEYEQEFQSIPMLYPMLSRSYLAVLRARSASLLRRTRRLASALTPATITPWSHLLTDASASTLTEPSSPWTEEYWALLEEAESTLASAQPALMRSSLRPSERLTTIGLKIGVIIALTAEAELYHLAPPVHAESRQQCLSTILKVVGIGKTFSALDYEMVDPFLGVCWVLVTRIAFVESSLPTDELNKVNWSTARDVLVACVPALKKALPYLEPSFNEILETAASFDRAH